MPNKSFIVNYLGGRAAAVGIWQQAFPFGGCSERAGGGLSTGASARSPEHSKQGEPCRGHRAGGPPLPLVGALQGDEGESKAQSRSSQTAPGEMRDERKQS